MTSPKEHKSDNLEIRMMADDKYNIKMHGTRIMDIDEVAVRPDRREKEDGEVQDEADDPGHAGHRRFHDCGREKACLPCTRCSRFTEDHTDKDRMYLEM